MPTAPPTTSELEAYRAEADRFIAELDEEHYLHYAGLKEDFAIEEIYERHAELTRLDKAQWLAAAAADDKRLTELWRFACEGYLGDLTRAQAEKIARLEARLEAQVDGESVSFRMLRPSIANEPDRAVRERLERARAALTEEHLNPIYLEADRSVKQAVGALGAPTYVELYRRFGFRLEELAEQCRAFLDSTERLWEEGADRLFRQRIGIRLDEAGPWDVPRLFRAEDWDSAFPADKMLPALEATLADLGIDLRSQSNVHLDLEQRPSKDPRAFCAPIEIPDKVMLVIQPIGGADDWRALFHEAGHTEHYAHTSPDLEMEEKRLGDLAVTEGWAMLLQHLTDEPAWLTRRLDFPRPAEWTSEGAISLLYFVRRYCGKLLYELEFHTADDPELMRSRYVEILRDALKIEISPANYLADMDSGFYATGYLRSWAFEAQIRSFLREKFGTTWFAQREAGSLLRELWELGQKPTADELLHEVTGAAIEMEAVADRIREAL